MRIRDALVLYAAVILLALADARRHRTPTAAPAAPDATAPCTATAPSAR